MFAITLNGAEPVQCVPPSVVVPSSVIEKPLPAGRPPMTVEIVVAWVVSIVPVREKLFGPVIVYETEFSIVPEASCSDSPTEPTSDFDTDPGSGEQPEPSVATLPRATTTMRARNRRVDMSRPPAIGAPPHA